jgi:ABC-type antimicrobial peptide transport system permease subunit
MYLLSALRSMRKRLGYTVLNVLGLTLGIATCLVIFLVVRYELSYDAFNRKADRIYKVNLHGRDYNPSISLAVAPALRVDFPELEQVSQVWFQDGAATIQVGKAKYEEKQLAFADGRLPQVLDYVWLEGDARTALAEPGSTVLTESVARKYFGAREAMGQTIAVDGNPYKVTGVIRDMPGNTHLPARAFFSFSTVEPKIQGMMHTFWAIPGGSFVYIVLPSNVSAARIQARMHAFIEKNWGKDVAKDANLLLQPLRDIHFEQQYNQTPVFQTTARQTYYALGGIALFIILIACINFVNLSTGLAITRAREVGVRKVLGASRPQLIGQLMGETAALVLLSVGLGLLAATLLLPSVNGWLDIQLSVSELYEWRVLALLAGMTAGVVLLAGLYPAFVQSAFRPVLSLKGVGGTRRKGLTLREGMVVLQFSISQLLIIGTIIVARQMDFFQNRDLGFNKDFAISFYSFDRSKDAVLQHEIASNPGVSSYCFNSASPVDNHSFTEFHSAELGLPNGDVTEMKFVDERYIRMFGIRMLAGDTIAPRPGRDTIGRAVVNETMLGKLNLQPGNALGKRFVMNGRNTQIIGVIADFQSESKHMKRRSCALLYDSSQFFEMCVKIRPGGMRETLASIGKSWSALYPDGLFKYEFLDDHIAALYRQEQKVYTAFRLFSGIAILIGCLGLYGLVAFAAVQRTKEVGVRKVLGASMANIVFLFGREFVVLIGIAFVVAAPVGWLVMKGWLDNFAYRISIGWGTFAVAVIISFAIAALTISWESVKAALVNPIKSLRSE